MLDAQLLDVLYFLGAFEAKIFAELIQKMKQHHLTQPVTGSAVRHT
jgi:hypothetical protein